MAYGDLRGVLTGNGASVGTSNNLTTGGPVTVSIGDLIFVTFGQQTNLTATGATDNLGNTYSAQNAGTDAGTVTGRSFYARVTVGGSLTTVTVAAASSTNDYAGVAAVIAGPVLTSPIDANPANNNNTDNASPFTCPATGALTQAIEIVLSWMVGTGTSATWSATSPNLKAGQANNTTNVNVIVGYKPVTVTTTTSPEFTGTNPTASVQGTASFKIDTSEPAAADRKIVDVKGTPLQEVTAQLRSWTWSSFPYYPPPAPPAEQFNQPRAPHFSLPKAFPPLGPTWAQRINTSLIPISLPPGSKVYDLPPQRHLPPGQTWYGLNPNLFSAPEPDTVNVKRVPHFTPPKAHPPAGPSWMRWFDLSRLPVVTLPPGIQEAKLSPQLPVGLRSWTWSFNLNLTIQPPVGERIFELSPREHAQPPKTWTWSYNLNLIGQDKLPAGAQVYDLPPFGPLQPTKTWTWNYNLNLIGQDKLPVGDNWLALPPQGYLYPTQARTWINTLNLAIVTAPVVLPFNQYQWPNPKIPGQPAKSWTWSYNLNLIGQDRLPVGEQFTEGKPGPLQPLRSWTWNYNLNLIGQDRLPVGAEVYALPPTGHIHPNQLRTWIHSVNVALVSAPPILPPGKQYTEGKPGPLQPLRSWAAWYNKNLIGQDRLPVGEHLSGLPPQGALYPNQARTWINSANLALAVQLVVPFKQTDWPTQKAAQRSSDLHTWTWSYNRNLIGQDRLPTGKQIFDLPPRAQPSANDIRTWIARVNLTLLQPKPPFNQFDWPVPKGHQQPDRAFVNLRNPNLYPSPVALPYNQYQWPTPQGWFVPYRDHAFVSDHNINLFPAPPLPPTVLPRDPTHVRTRGGFELDARGAGIDQRGAGIDQRGTSPDRRGGGRFSRGRNES